MIEKIKFIKRVRLENGIYCLSQITKYKVLGITVFAIINEV